MRSALSRLSIPLKLMAAVAVLWAASGCVEEKTSSIVASGSVDIISLTASPDTIFINEQSIIQASIDNPEGQTLSYSWQAYRGAVAGDGPQVRYFGSYCCAGTDWVVLTVTDEDGGTVEKAVVMHVIGTTQ